MGMHGSVLSQALRWMDSDRHLLETVPDMGPGSKCLPGIRKNNGRVLPYYFNKCDDFEPHERWTGKMDKYGNKEMGKWNGNADAGRWDRQCT